LLVLITKGIKPYHSYTNTKKSIVFDVYQVGIKGMYWISPTPNVSHGHLAVLDTSVPGVVFGSLTAARRNYLSVRCVPEAEVSPGILNVGFGEFTTGEYR
jgi:hypothetical protein